MTRDADVTATVPVIEPPTWAVLQRQLFATLDRAWREFEATYCEPDGRLRYAGRMFGRDGADDFYEPFFNWPILYLLGGSPDILAAAKKHWEGVTAQLTELGYLVDEYERGYDWFHQGESLEFFYALCAADPADAAFRERALRFARLYLPGSGNYDPATRTIVNPHTGSGGPRPGVGEDWETYSADQTGMKPYGLPLDDVEGIRTWDDLRDPENARRMGQAMQERMGHGDTAINLAATALAANAWLYDNEPEFADWIAEYVGAWRERAAANEGLLPDNVGPHGAVGELHSGRWYGGHYGWQWPHGLHSVGSAALVAATADELVTGDETAWGLARTPLDIVIALGEDVVFDPERSTLGHWWASHLPDELDHPLRIVPYRHGDGGWFDWHPVPVNFVFWLWWSTGSDEDRDRLRSVLDDAGYDWRRVRLFQDKEEAGHESAWYAWLTGENPDWPEQALRMALGQVARRLALLRQDDGRSQGDDIHWWQLINPVVTEILSQQISGAPAALYNGGLPPARLRYWDDDSGRPGLPEGVAALVTSLTHDTATVELVNLDPASTRRLQIQGGAYAEDRIDAATFTELADAWPGAVHGRSDITEPATTSKTVAPRAFTVSVELPPLTRTTLSLELARRARSPRHRTFASLQEGTR
jgi:hypothetical protein